MNPRFCFAFVCVILLSKVDFGIGKKERPATVTIGDKTFNFYDDPVVFDVANQRCVEKGGKLAVIRDRTLALNLRHLVHNIYLGKTDMNLIDPI